MIARAAPVLAASALIAICARSYVQTREYARVWHDHHSLFSRIVQADSLDYRGYQLLAMEAKDEGRYENPPGSTHEPTRSDPSIRPCCSDTAIICSRRVGGATRSRSESGCYAIPTRGPIRPRSLSSSTQPGRCGAWIRCSWRPADSIPARQARGWRCSWAWLTTQGRFSLGAGGVPGRSSTRPLGQRPQLGRSASRSEFTRSLTTPDARIEGGDHTESRH